mmetsp:Transcript_22192/g.79097  ORF Transcript_22192/g.79097 Transcript_22192/m.79097 type:complete len:379 (+) Transcript_22192:2515-3651(+)
MQRHARGHSSVARWRAREIGRALSAWRAAAVRAKRREVVVRRVVGRVAHGALARALACWVAETRAERRRQVTLARFRGRMRNATAARAFACWVGMVSERQRLRGIVLRTVARASNKNTGGAWRTWTADVGRSRTEAAEEAALKRKNDVVLSRATARLRLRGASRAFEAWRVYVEERKRLRRLVGATVGRLANGRQAAAFRAWLEASRAMAAAELEASRAREARKRQVERVFKRMQSARLWAAFSAWLAAARKIARMQKIIKKVLTRFAHGKLAVAIEKWVAVLAPAEPEAAPDAESDSDSDDDDPTCCRRRCSGCPPCCFAAACCSRRPTVHAAGESPGGTPGAAPGTPRGAAPVPWYKRCCGRPPARDDDSDSDDDA